MAAPVSLPSPLEGARDHHFHPLRIQRIVAETDDARSYVLDVPDELRDAFAEGLGAYRARDWERAAAETYRLYRRLLAP